MIPYTFAFPAGSIITGELLRDYSGVTERLSPDIMQVMLPTGYGIDVGWFPSFDPGGSFQIVAFKDVWDNQIIAPIEAHDPAEVSTVVESLSREFAQGVIPSR